MTNVESLLHSRPKSALIGLEYAKPKKSKMNPFTIPPAAELLAKREDEEIRIQAERDTIRTLTLKQRADRLKPPVPEYLRQSSQRGSRAASSFASTNRNLQTQITTGETKTRKHESIFLTDREMIRENNPYFNYEFNEDRTDVEQQSATSTKNESRRITEFIQQKREIFLFQMIVDRKKKQIQKLNKQISNEESALAEQERDIEEASQACKLQNSKVESDLARARKKMENATRKRVEATKKLRVYSQQIATMKSDINKNIELLENYRDYKDFLISMTPNGEDPETYFTKPEDLLIQLTAIENENLFIFDHLENMMDLQNRGESGIMKGIEETDLLIENAQENLTRINHINAFTDEIDNNRVVRLIDEEIENLYRLINKLFTKCYKKESTVSPILMLGKIESDLESMYKTMQQIDPAFINEKQTMFDKRRREQQRKEKQELQMKEQRIKMEQALKRAKEPIKRHTNRPLFPKSSPIKVHKTNDAKLIRQKEEQERVDNLLFGELYP